MTDLAARVKDHSLPPDVVAAVVAALEKQGTRTLGGGWHRFPCRPAWHRRGSKEPPTGQCLAGRAALAQVREAVGK